MPQKKKKLIFFFQHLHLHPVESFFKKKIYILSQTSYGFASGNPAPAHKGENRSGETEVLEVQ